ncbi:hypothetical protein T06_6024 [Trichinella sp. T6]|nr:hypothetical protein T06_6024 [Trichinella sp. T6]
MQTLPLTQLRHSRETTEKRIYSCMKCSSLLFLFYSQLPLARNHSNAKKMQTVLQISHVPVQKVQCLPMPK